MGSGGAKETNQLLGQQQDLANQFASTMGERGTQAYNQQNDIRNELLGDYRNLYSGTLNGGRGIGGGGGPGGDIRNFWQNMFKTGGYSDADKGLILSNATGPISGMFEGIARNLASSAAGGGLPSYSGNVARATRDQAYAAGDMMKNVSAGLVDKILANKIQGANKIQSMRAAAAARARGAQQYNDQLQLQYLSRMQGLMPEDLPYAQAQLAGMGQGLNAIQSRQSETPLWQKALASLPGQAAGAAMGAFMPSPGGKGGGLSMPEPGSAALSYGWGGQPGYR